MELRNVILDFVSHYCKQLNIPLFIDRQKVNPEEFSFKLPPPPSPDPDLTIFLNYTGIQVSGQETEASFIDSMTRLAENIKTYKYDENEKPSNNHIVYTMNNKFTSKLAEYRRKVSSIASLGSDNSQISAFRRNSSSMHDDVHKPNIRHIQLIELLNNIETGKNFETYFDFNDEEVERNENPTPIENITKYKFNIDEEMVINNSNSILNDIDFEPVNNKEISFSENEIKNDNKLETFSDCNEDIVIVNNEEMEKNRKVENDDEIEKNQYNEETENDQDIDEVIKSENNEETENKKESCVDKMEKKYVESIENGEQFSEEEKYKDRKKSFLPKKITQKNTTIDFSSITKRMVEKESPHIEKKTFTRNLSLDEKKIYVPYKHTPKILSKDEKYSFYKSLLIGVSDNPNISSPILRSSLSMQAHSFSPYSEKPPKIFSSELKSRIYNSENKIMSDYSYSPTKSKVKIMQCDTVILESNEDLISKRKYK